MKRKRKPKTIEPEFWPNFMVWCPADQRFDALASTLVVLAGEEGICFVRLHPQGDPKAPDYVYVPQPQYFVPPREAIELIRPDYERCGNQTAIVWNFRASSGRDLRIEVGATRDRNFENLPGYSSLFVAFMCEPFVEGELLPPAILRFKGIETPMEFDAGVAWFMATNDMLHILRRFCTSHPAITMGCCLAGPEWSAPLTGAASYHADGYPGRDLALSWLHLHDKDPLDLAVGWSMDALRERVEASPPQSSIWIVDEDRISREQILAALDVPRKTLVETLDAAASNFHPRWDAMVTAGFGSYLQTLSESADEKEAALVTEEHIQYIEECSPGYVMRLDHDALILCAHPDRTLWPLWANALDLLGIRPKTS